MAFKASKAKSGFFEIHGLEAFIEQKVAELKHVLGLDLRGAKAAPAVQAAKPLQAAKRPVKKAAAPKQARPVRKGPLDEVLAALDAHPQKAGLIKAGKQKDQLLRSLIPLYVAQGNVEVSSGTMSKFWAKHVVKYAAPNAAKALRQHTGYARRTAKGQQITANGVKYVEQALNGKRAAV